MNPVEFAFSPANAGRKILCRGWRRRSRADRRRSRRTGSRCVPSDGIGEGVEINLILPQSECAQDARNQMGYEFQDGLAGPNLESRVMAATSRVDSNCMVATSESSKAFTAEERTSKIPSVLRK